MPLKDGLLGRDKMNCMRNWLKAFPAQIVFITHNKDIAVAASYKRRYDRSLKLVYQQHMQVGVNKKDFLHTRRYNMLDLWIAPLNYLKEETIQRTAVPASKIKVIPLGVEAERFVKNDIPQNDARAKLSLPQDKKIFGVLGRIDPKKGQDFLIAATKMLRDAFRADYHLLIMGAVTPHEGNEHLDALYKMVEDNGLGDRVHFRESTPQVELFYSAIDVFAMPSFGETYGMVTLEAMAAGRPVIGTNKDGTKEILQSGRLGYVYELGDTAGFCRQLIALLEDKNLDQLIHAARNEVLERYTKEAMTQQLDETLKRLL
jgi:glycosyltransferase involved in cell wall biosynthesis